MVNNDYVYAGADFQVLVRPARWINDSWLDLRGIETARQLGQQIAYRLAQQRGLFSHVSAHLDPQQRLAAVNGRSVIDRSKGDDILGNVYNAMRAAGLKFNDHDGRIVLSNNYSRAPRTQAEIENRNPVDDAGAIRAARQGQQNRQAAQPGLLDNLLGDIDRAIRSLDTSMILVGLVIVVVLTRK